MEKPGTGGRQAAKSWAKKGVFQQEKDYAHGPARGALDIHLLWCASLRGGNGRLLVIRTCTRWDVLLSQTKYPLVPSRAKSWSIKSNQIISYQIKSNPKQENKGVGRWAGVAGPGSWLTLRNRACHLKKKVC